MKKILLLTCILMMAVSIESSQATTFALKYVAANFQRPPAPPQPKRPPAPKIRVSSSHKAPRRPAPHKPPLNLHLKLPPRPPAPSHLPPHP